jgi:hypothetical protein
MYSHLKTPDHILKRRAEVAAKKAALRREISFASFDCPANVHVQCNARKNMHAGVFAAGVFAVRTPLCFESRGMLVNNLLELVFTCVFVRPRVHTFLACV